MRLSFGVAAMAATWSTLWLAGCAPVAARQAVKTEAAQPVAAAPPVAVPQPQREARRLAAEPAVPVQAIHGHVDHSGRKQKGKASYYARKFDGRKMANGRRFDPNANVAASKTLPLGTVAKVKNLENGKTATVKIEDRGPHVGGRVVDLSPKVAEKLDMKKEGIAPVVVAPVTVPQPDGGVKLGAGAAPGPLATAPEGRAGGAAASEEASR